MLNVVCFSVVDQTRYRRATSYCRSVQLLGYTVGSVLGQLLVSFHLMSYNNIMVLTLVLTTIALPVSCLLPMPQQSMFFHRELNTKSNGDGTIDAAEHTSASNNSLEETKEERMDKSKETVEDTVRGKEERPKAEDLEESVGSQSCSQVLLQLWRDFSQCYSSRQLLCWSVWWAMATCGYNQTINYVQVSQEADKNEKK